MRVSWRHDDQLRKDALPDMHDQSEKQYRTLLDVIERASGKPAENQQVSAFRLSLYPE